MKNSLFINKFQSGSKENANIGVGNIVGIDTYSKKGIAMLAKATTFSQVFTDKVPHFVIADGQNLWAQFENIAGDRYQSVYTSTDAGVTWTNMTFPANQEGACGMIYFQGYIFCFTTTKIYYHDSGTTPGSWTDWTTAKGLGTLNNLATSPISGLHFPFLYPNGRGVYFGNGNAGGTSNAIPSSNTIGFFGQNGTTLFNPGGTLGTDFIWNGGILALPSSTYMVGNIDFLPPSKIAINAYPFHNNMEGGDLITWDTVSANKFDPPLRMYSNSLGTLRGGNKQLYNRNQVLYAVAGGNHTVYETNGSSFNFVEDISLFSNVRLGNGTQSTYPVFFNSYPQAIGVMGNKLLTGVATGINISTYPPTSYGIFPIGVWSIAFNADGSKSTQCEFVVPSGTNPVSPSGTNNYSKITCLCTIGSGKILIGFATFSASTLEAGVAVVDSFNYVTSRAQTAIESEMFEIGTYLIPETVNNIETNLVKPLLTGQTIDLSYRTGFDQAWTVLDTYTGDGIATSFALTKNPIGATQFIQLRIRMETGSPNVTDSPQLKTVILS